MGNPMALLHGGCRLWERKDLHRGSRRSQREAGAVESKLGSQTSPLVFLLHSCSLCQVDRGWTSPRRCCLGMLPGPVSKLMWSRDSHLACMCQNQPEAGLVACSKDGDIELDTIMKADLCKPSHAPLVLAAGRYIRSDTIGQRGFSEEGGGGGWLISAFLPRFIPRI